MKNIIKEFINFLYEVDSYQLNRYEKGVSSECKTKAKNH